MSALQRAIAAERVWEGELVGLEVAGVPVLLVRAGDVVYAYLNRCPHMGVRLSEGALAGDTLTCRAHGWCFDVCAGVGLNPRAATLQRLLVEERDGHVYVSVSEVSSCLKGARSDRY